MPEAMIAAYNTIPKEFQIHQLTAQFFHGGQSKSPLTFEVVRSNDTKNGAGRIVNINQNEKLLAIIVMSFMRKPLLDGLSLSYEPAMPLGITEPQDDQDDIKHVNKGIISGQALDMVISPYIPLYQTT